jgi:hypothetical protein
MMEHYVTLFDSLFLPQGLALHQSLERYAGSYRLWVLCMDAAALDVLQKLNLPNVALIPLAEVETPELLRVKLLRTVGEYCWTLTPFTPGFVFDRDASVQRVTYVDADTWFLRNPSSLFAELDASSKAVLITEHAYAPENDQAVISGRYCVQFVTFQRGRGDVVRLWWAERCLEWCYARVENGKFGDQKYLDEWPTRFAGDVHVLHDKALCQAPWNVTRFPPSEAAFFHFHSLRLLRGQTVQIVDSGYEIPRSTIRTIYKPYLADFAASLTALSQIGYHARPQIDKPVAGLRIGFAVMRLLRWGSRLFIRPRIFQVGD